MTSLPRWSEGDGPSDPDLRAALIDARRGPSETELSALAEGVAERLRIRGQATGRVVEIPWRARTVVGLASIALVLSAGWWWSAQRVERAVPAAAPEMRAAPQANPIAPTAEPSVLTPTVERPAPQAEREPAPIASRAPARKRAQTGHKESADAGDEVQLLQAARRALLSRPEQALSLTDQHTARFAHGIFVEEREAIAIEALLKLGRAAQAERALKRFLSDYPQSTYRTRLLRLREER